MKYKILVACEESQAVTIAFRKLGFEAYSNDIIECSGGHPEWHLQMDIFSAVAAINPNVVIAFPPCTYLTISANAHYLNNPERWKMRLNALLFVHKIMNLNINHISIENPVGVISTHIRKPDQIIQPYEYGDPEIKRTCLWLKNLPKLKPTNIVEPEYVLYRHKKTKSGFSKYGKITGTCSSTNNPANARKRSKTYPGIAKAMAEQWGAYLNSLK